MYKNFYLSLVGGIIILGLLFVAFRALSRSPNTNGNLSASSTQPANNDLLTYSSEDFGFTVNYPKDIMPTETFDEFHILPATWRVYAKEDGVPVVEFPVMTIDQEGNGVATGKLYPLFFKAALRIGVSTSTKTCFDTDQGYADEKVTDVTINGTTFKKFEFADAAMMKYVQGESYRTIHNNMCYVLEQIRTGSSYRDDTMSTGTPENILVSYYDIAGDIVKTFQFTK